MRSVSVLICWAASGLADVNWIDTLTASLAAETSLTRPKETMSREKPGYLTAFSAFKTDSCVSIRPTKCQRRRTTPNLFRAKNVKPAKCLARSVRDRSRESILPRHPGPLKYRDG